MQLSYSPAGGAFFNVDKMAAGRYRAQKSFMDVMSRRVAKTAQPATCQTCECVVNDMGVTHTVCKPCPGYTPVASLGHMGEEPEQFYKEKSPVQNM